MADNIIKNLLEKYNNASSEPRDSRKVEPIYSKPAEQEPRNPFAKVERITIRVPQDMMLYIRSKGQASKFIRSLIRAKMQEEQQRAYNDTQ